MKKSRKLPKKTFFLVFVIGLVAILNVLMAVGDFSYGVKIMQLETEASKLREDNRELSSKVILSSSFTRLLDEANGLGMKKPDSIVYLSSGKNFAKLP